MKKDYIIWDWNGTLFDDVALCMESINYLLKKEGLPLLVDKDAYQRVFRFPIIRYYEAVGFDFTKRSFDELAQDYMAYYQPRSLSQVLYPDAIDVLETFQKQGYVQVLLSASKKNYLHAQVKQFPLEGYFKDIVALDDIHANSKAELARSYVESQRANMKSVTFIGDSVHDYEVSCYAGGACILIANGHEHKDKLIATGTRVVDQLRPMIAIINPAFAS